MPNMASYFLALVNYSFQCCPPKSPPNNSIKERTRFILPLLVKKTELNQQQSHSDFYSEFVKTMHRSRLVKCFLSGMTICIGE